MSTPQHHFMPTLNAQSGMRSQFGSGPMQTQMGPTMQTQLGNQLSNQIPVPMPSQMAPQMNAPMMSQMANSLNNQMSTGMSSGNQMMAQINQQYSINGPNQMPQHQNPAAMQMPPAAMAGLQHHAMQQPQQPVMQPTANVAPTPPSQPQTSQAKEFNTASLCRIGQETVQDIVSRTQEVFQMLRTIQPPNGTPQGTNNSNEKKAKIQEQLRTIRVLFKRLRLIYEKCNENCQIQGMEYTHIESLIPFKDEIDPKYDEKKNSEAYRLVCEESKEVMEQVVLKNKQLKEVIDHLRRIIWEINTMLSMRRS
ncbi:Mediator complex subunit 30 [Popillia japonica]|uniref:Mediator of RNA polymerase II transcription subunit 30 n=1 Tax=Popillia japonica TaxID=7064 RepID=A0AAW1NIX0_POPJA